MKLGSSSIPEGGQRKESAIFTFLICCGCLGIFATHFFLNPYSNQVGSPTDILIQSTPPTPPDVVFSKVSGNENSPVREKLFYPKDYLEAELLTTFTIQNASHEVFYELEVENGVRKPFIDGQVKHIFHKDGTVKVSLFGTFEGKTKFLQAQVYPVHHAAEIEVATGFVELDKK